jgi:signal transduction histidine kinase
VSWRDQPRLHLIDERRRETIELLTGRNSSKKTYYPALREKIEELEVSNGLLMRAREQAERLTGELQRAVMRTSSVLKATRHISRHLKLEEVLEETLSIITGPMGYPWAAVHVFKEPPNEGELLIEAASSSNLLIDGRSIAAADLLIEPGFVEARKTGRIVQQRGASAEEGLVTLVLVPVLSAGQSTAVLSVASLDLRPEDLEVFQGISQSLAMAIENASLYRRVSCQAQRLDRSLDALSSISRALTLTTQGVEAFLGELGTTIERLTDAEHVLVLEVGGEGSRRLLRPLWWTGCDVPSGVEWYARQRHFSHLLPRMRRESEPYWLDSETLQKARESDAWGVTGRSLLPQPALCIPVLGPQGTSGAIIALLPESRTIESSELETLRILGNQIAVSLENARLYDEGDKLRRQAEKAAQQALEQKRETERKHKQLQRALNKINAIEKQQIVQEERARIARDLHDTASQVLYSIGLGIDWCRKHTEPESEIHVRLTGLHALARSCVQEIRQSIFDLAPADVTELGLLHALHRLAGEFPKLAAIKLTLDVPYSLPQMSQRWENELYRIIQEALFNVYKHSRAHKVTVTLRQLRGDLVLRIEDDGIGMPEGQLRGYLRDLPRFGLTSMRERAEKLGGTLEMSSTPGAGTRVVVRIPLVDSQAAARRRAKRS